MLLVNCSSVFDPSGTIGVGTILVIMTVVAIPLMDRVGRRTLHLVGLLGIIICSVMITVSLQFTTKLNREKAQIKIDNIDINEIHNHDINDIESNDGITVTDVWLIVSTYGFVIFFAIGPGSVAWIAASEAFTQGPRSAAASLCVFTNWFGYLIVGLVFPQLQMHLKLFSFVPFISISSVLLLVLLFYFVETKGKSSNEVALQYQVPNGWTKPIGMKSYVSKDIHCT